MWSAGLAPGALQSCILPQFLSCQRLVLGRRCLSTELLSVLGQGLIRLVYLHLTMITPVEGTTLALVLRDFNVYPEADGAPSPAGQEGRKADCPAGILSPPLTGTGARPGGERGSSDPARIPATKPRLLPGSWSVDQREQYKQGPRTSYTSTAQ